MNKKHKELPARTTYLTCALHKIQYKSSKILACLLVLLTSMSCQCQQHPWGQIHLYLLGRLSTVILFICSQVHRKLGRDLHPADPSYLQVQQVSGKILPLCASTATPSQSTWVGYLLIWKQTMSSAPQIHEYLYKKRQFLLLNSIRRSRVAQADSPRHSFSCCQQRWACIRTYL